MDIANRLAHWKELPPDQWLGVTNRFLPPAATAILVLVIAYRLAAMTWLVIPGQRPDSPPPEIAPTGASSTPSIVGATFELLANSHLFGVAPEQESPFVLEEFIDAPDTTLNLELFGVQTRETSDVGIAIISSGGGEQNVYSVGDSIEGTNGAILHAIYEFRVILNRDGRLETLRLPKEDANPTVSSLGRIAPRPAARGSSLRDVISANATRITEIIRLAPHLEGGQMIGFRVNPGRDREAFSALGLEPGDVVTDVNGTVVNDPNRGIAVFEALGEATMANVTVRRNGVAQVIVIDTSQLENLAENRQ